MFANRRKVGAVLSTCSEEKKRELDSLLGFIDKLWRSSGGGDGTC